MTLKLLKFLPFLSLVVALSGFFYFETSLFVKVLAVLCGLISLFALRSAAEIFTLLLLYLGLIDLYNFRYLLAVPLAVVLLAVFLLTVLAFRVWSQYEIGEEAKQPLVSLFGAVTGLLVMEMFLTMSFWPVDPKVKSLMVVMLYYVLEQIFCMRLANVLNLKRIILLIFISLLLGGGVLILNVFVS